jgi:DNA polymerase-4
MSEALTPPRHGLVRDLPFAPGPLRWLFVDMNSFFASVEQYDNPRWRGKPMIVIPMLTDATCAIAALLDLNPGFVFELGIRLRS